MDLTLRKFNPATIEDGRTIFIIAKRNSGKSVLTKDIMFFKRHIPLGIVQSGTEEGNGYYSSFVPDIFVYSDLDLDAINRLIERQRRACKEGKARPAFIVLDDLMYDAKFLKDKTIRSIFMNGRHWKIFIIVTAQFAGDIPPAIRSNIDYVFVLRENILQNRERLFRNFFGIFPSFDSFCQTLDATTNNYECLVLDNTSKSNKIEDCIFWYKADPNRSFRMGSTKMWDYHKKTYNPRHDQVDEAKANTVGRIATASKPKLTIQKSKAKA